MKSLEVLSLASTSISGYLLTEIGECLNLTTLSIQDSFNISGRLPTELWSLPALTSLNTYGVTINVDMVDKASGNAYWKANRGLRDVLLSGNLILSTVPSQLALLPSLEYLELDSANKVCKKQQNIHKIQLR